jgi:hypothetical protein
MLSTFSTEYQTRPQFGVRGGAIAKLIVFLVVIFAFVALAWMMFLPAVLTTQLRKRSGFDATVERLAFNPLTGQMEIRGFTLLNPPTFPVSDFLEIREFRANAEARSLFSDRPVFDTMVIDISRVTLVKRQDGTTNASALENNLRESDVPRSLRARSHNREFLIRQLILRVDRLTVADYSLRQPSEREFSLNLNQTYNDVTQVDQLLAPSVLKNLAPVATAMAGFIPGELGRAVDEAGRSGTEILQHASRKAGERVKDALEESKKPYLDATFYVF